MAYYEENRLDAVETYMANGPNADRTRWSLEGDDAGDFRISQDGVLNFRRSPDYENPIDMDMDNMYMVTIMADDRTAHTDTYDVMVMVTNVEELGMLLGISSLSYMENSDDAVETYTADGPMADMANWSLMGDDKGDLSISSGGVLTFNTPPNYEMPMDEGMDNMYEVIVKAEVGGEMDDITVTVAVGNMEEPGTVTLSSPAPRVDTEIRADLVDEDMVTENTVMWQWSRSMTMGGTYDAIEMANSMTYTPVDDEGYYLRATARYDDGEGDGKMAMGTTTSTVTAADPLLAEYDDNDNEKIDIDEIRRAFSDYIGGGISIDVMRALFALYIQSG